MAHDGQRDIMTSMPILEDVLSLARNTVKPLKTLNEKAINKLQPLIKYKFQNH